MDTNLETLKEAIEYAKKTGSFNTLNMIEQAENVCIWGAGTYFLEAYERYFASRGIQVDYVVDSNPDKNGKKILGVPCISPEQLFLIENAIVIPLLKNGYDEVIKECKEKQILWINPMYYFFDVQHNGERSISWFSDNCHKLEEVYHMLEDEESRFVYTHIVCHRIADGMSNIDFKELYSDGEYFNPRGLYQLEGNECFVDVGAFNGDSIQNFLDATENNFEEIISLELSKANYAKLNNRVMTYREEIRNKISIYNMGAWNEECLMPCGEEPCHSGEGFSINKGKSDFLTNEEMEYEKVVPLDTLLASNKVTFIKMDIEGAEQNALEGAKQIIQKQTPKLAICIYHSLEDLWEVPLQIKRMVPEYKIGVRHHAANMGDTVCYAYI